MSDGAGTPLDELWRRLADAQDAAIAGGVSTAPDLPSARDPKARSSQRRLRAGALVLAVGAAAAGVMIYAHRSPLRVQLGRGGQPGAPGEVVVADARSDLPLLFSDGSTVTFRAGATGRMQRLTAAGAELGIDHGRLEAHVVHAASTLWLVHAGPYRVRVTGTRFVVDWQSPRLHVAVYEGSVVVDGGALGAGVPLRAGQVLTISDGVVRTEGLAAVKALDRRLAARTGAITDGAPTGASPLPSSPASAGDADRFQAPGSAAADPADVIDERVDSPTRSRAGGDDDAAVEVRAGTARTSHLGRLVDTDDARPQAAGGDRRPRPGTVPALDGAAASRTRVALASGARDRDWLPPAERGDYGEAVQLARKAGWSRLCGRLDARRLLMLGDVARYAGAPGEARTAFKALVRRFPKDRLAGDAVFSLGRLAFEADHPQTAATWFRLYVSHWPGGPMADQALGRLLECSVRMKDGDGARRVSRDYLARAPHGPHASLASKILSAPVGGSAADPESSSAP